MVKSDMLFQLDLRLKEITQKPDKLFGGVPIFCFGDIMQLKSVKANYIFEIPRCPDFHLAYYCETHWQSFQVINLEENHRQDGDKQYADMLNRIRLGIHTEDDLEKLKTKVRGKNHHDLKGAMHISCTNSSVVEMNTN